MGLPDIANVNPHRLRQLVHMVDLGTVAAAARSCGVTASAVRQSLKAIEDASGGRALIDHGGAAAGLAPNVSVTEKVLLTPHGEDVVRAARAVVAAVEAFSRVEPTQCVLSALPHHALWLGGVLKDHAAILDFRVLEESDRNTDRFQEAVIAPVKFGAVDAVIGPPIAPGKGTMVNHLRSVVLYTARLMAQVVSGSAAADSLVEGSVIPLEKLVKHQLLVPPKGIRSRDILDSTVSAHGLDFDTAYEGIQTKVLCHYGRIGNGITTLPSDLARPFSKTGEFGGKALRENDYDWYPIVHGPDRVLIEHQVCLTTRLARNSATETIATAIDAELNRKGLRAALQGDFHLVD